MLLSNIWRVSMIYSLCVGAPVFSFAHNGILGGARVLYCKTGLATENRTFEHVGNLNEQLLAKVDNIATNCIKKKYYYVSSNYFLQFDDGRIYGIVADGKNENGILGLDISCNVTGRHVRAAHTIAICKEKSIAKDFLLLLVKSLFNDFHDLRIGRTGDNGDQPVPTPITGKIQRMFENATISRRQDVKYDYYLTFRNGLVLGLVLDEDGFITGFDFSEITGHCMRDGAIHDLLTNAGAGIPLSELLQSVKP